MNEKNRNGQPLSQEEEERLEELLAERTKRILLPEEADEATHLANRKWGIGSQAKTKEG